MSNDPYETLRIIVTEWVAATHPPIALFAQAERALATFKKAQARLDIELATDAVVNCELPNAGTLSDVLYEATYFGSAIGPDEQPAYIRMLCRTIAEAALSSQLRRP